MIVSYRYPTIVQIPGTLLHGLDLAMRAMPRLGCKVL